MLSSSFCRLVIHNGDTLRKRLSDLNRGLKDGQRKHRRSFEQERSYPAKCRKDQLQSKTFLDSGELFLKRERKEFQHGQRWVNIKKDNLCCQGQDILKKKKWMKEKKISSGKGKTNFKGGWINSWVVLLNSKRP